MITITINGQTTTVDEGASIIEAADAAGVPIPRFCYHKKLSVAANCRMCLVEVEGMNKPVPACATPVSMDMSVQTQSEMAKAAQQAVMEFLLVNHPLDCPICDQGGQCELQDMAMAYSSGYSDFNEDKRAVFSQDLGPLIETGMTRCIHCTRCVRFGEEIAGVQELGVLNRGESSEITTALSKMVSSELSGNAIDLCPVGALTAKPSRYQYRGWEAIERPSIAMHDCVGSHIYAHVREKTQRHPVLRVVPREADDVNENWLSDRDRFSYEGLSDQQRLLEPMIKRDGRWHSCSWDEAIRRVAQQVGKQIAQHGSDTLGAWVSPQLSTEDAYACQAWVRSLGSNHIDCALRDAHTHYKQFVTMEDSMMPAELGAQSLVICVGSLIRTEQPMLAHRLRQAVAKGALVAAINPCQDDWHMPLAAEDITEDCTLRLQQLLDGQVTDQAWQAVLDRCAVQPMCIVLGAYALQHPQCGQIIRLAQSCIKRYGGRLLCLPEGANSRGLYWAGACAQSPQVAGQMQSSRHAQSVARMCFSTKHAMMLVGVEPEHDVCYPAAAMTMLQQCASVVAITAYRTDALEQVADVLLPMAAPLESSGSMIAIGDSWQRYEPVCSPPGQAKTAWSIFRALARIGQKHSIATQSFSSLSQWLEDQYNRSQQSVQSQPEHGALTPVVTKPTLLRWARLPCYRIDPIVRRASSLQASPLGQVVPLALSVADAAHLGIQDGDQVRVTQEGQSIILPAHVSAAVATGLVMMPAGIEQTRGFGAHMAPISCERVGGNHD